jgi:shikimate dehydrogenase
MIESRTDRYGVMGHPIAHSKSPRIHGLFARQTGQRMRYEAILVPLDGFGEALAEFRAAGGRGLNITVPFKQAAWEAMDALSPRADMAGAVNTVVFRDDATLFGDNTDGIGLVRDITVNHGVDLARARLLVLGAGGAVRGVLGPLLEQGPAELCIANRTASRAHDLASRFATNGPVSGSGLAALAGRRFDVIINGTAAGLQDEVPAIPPDCLEPGGFCYDLVYGDTPTAFVRWGRRHGAGAAVDGLGMLVEQAAESFLLWRGVRPDTAPVIRALRPVG